MHLEVVDKRNPVLIRAASIVQVEAYSIKIHFWSVEVLNAKCVHFLKKRILIIVSGLEWRSLNATLS